MSKLFAMFVWLGVAASCIAQEPLRLVQTIELPNVEGRMDHMSVDAKGQRLFASGLANGTVEVIDLKAGARVHTITGIQEPEGLLWVAEWNTLFVADGEGNAVHAYDGATYKRLRTTPQLPHADNLRYDPNTQRLYVGFGDGPDAGLGIIDGREGALISVINLDGHPESFQFSANGRQIFVNCPTVNHIALIDSGKRRVIAKWPVQEVKSFYPMDVDHANQRIFIGSRKPARLAVFEMTSGKMTATVDGAVDTDDLFYDGVRKRIYMAGGDGFVLVFDQKGADQYVLSKKVVTGVGARIALFVPALNRLYVAVPRMGRQTARVLVFEVQ